MGFLIAFILDLMILFFLTWLSGNLQPAADVPSRLEPNAVDKHKGNFSLASCG